MAATHRHVRVGKMKKLFHFFVEPTCAENDANVHRILNAPSLIRIDGVLAYVFIISTKDFLPSAADPPPNSGPPLIST